ncbi:MAG: hypothetical protein KDM91_08810 [Verrucomicrobiae bacterium]|nr:hypothetical protein [Verrucomicrobiae bacterium]MCP5538793.1 hypothetical protein [Akkermansiaceae bacterium]MCP5549552.1 hypothetical protein [Akkermansiaceae bacterium]
MKAASQFIPLPALVALLAAAHPFQAAFAEERNWTSTDGKTVPGEIVALEEGEITLKTARGDFKFPLSRLSEEDQAFAKAWKEKADSQPAANDSQSFADFSKVKLGEWPNSVAADFDEDKIAIVKEDKESNEFVYRSPHFEFRSPTRLSKTVIVEFSRIFEATYEFASVIPIGLNPKPFGEGYYPTQLYASREDYYGDGGMQGSGGMHSSSWRGGELVKSIIKVPLPNLGVEFTGTRYIVDHKKQSDTLVHEIAHQVTGKWLILTPVWFKEGLAETISTQRYDNGRFTLTSMDRSIREDLSRRSGTDREFSMIPLERLMTISSAEWAADLATPGASRNYPSANVLFYYYLRLEGDGKATTLVNYMKALAEGKKEEEARVEILLGGKSFAQLQEDVADKWRSEGLRLEFY